MASINNIPGKLPSVGSAPAAAAQPASAAAPAPNLPSDQVSLGNAAPTEAPKPQHELDGPVQPLDQPLPQKKWTVMLWSCSGNNLYKFMQQDIDEAEKVGSTEHMNIVVQTDHEPAGGTAKIYELHQDANPGLTSPVRADLGKVDMGDHKELAKFVKWTMEHYPAEHFALIVSDHGAKDGSCHDEGQGGWITHPEMRQALEEVVGPSGKKLDVVGFDCCLMASAENVHELRNVASYVVGSEEVEGGAGWTYNEIVSKKETRSANRIFSPEMLEGANTAMRSRLDFTPEEFARNVVESAKGHQGDLATMTAFDTAKVGKIAEAAKEFATALLDSGVPLIELKKAKRSAQGFRQNKDLGDFAKKVAAVPGAEEKLVESAKAVQAAIAEAIVAEQHSTKYPGATGMQIDLNPTRTPEGEALVSLPPNMDLRDAVRIDTGKYSDNQWAIDTNWQAVQDRLAQKVDGFVENEGLQLPGGLTAEDILSVVGALLGQVMAGSKEA